MSDGLHARLAGRIGGFALDVAFAAPRGQVTALLGPSGSGKSSVLRCLAGLQRLEGTIRVDDAVWQGDGVFLPPHARRVGYVFQGDSLLPHLSVAGNLHYAARRARGAAADRDGIVARTGVSMLLDRAPRSLSGGERQRVALARALLVGPRVLLLDEPFSGLDAAGKAGLMDFLGELLPALAIPVLLVSHDPAEPARLASRVVRLAGGRVVAPAEPERVPA